MKRGDRYANLMLVSIGITLVTAAAIVVAVFVPGLRLLAVGVIATAVVARIPLALFRTRELRRRAVRVRDRAEHDA